jgi:putative redox protein
MMFDPMSYEVPGKRQRPQGFWRFRFLGTFACPSSAFPSAKIKCGAQTGNAWRGYDKFFPGKGVLMRADLSVRAVHRGSMRVNVHVRDHVLAMDYPAEPGKAPTPLEMLMASLAACAANTLNLVLCRKMGASVGGLEVSVAAERRADHPTVLTRIEIGYHLRGEGLDARQIEQAVRMAEGQLCPVLAMLRPGTTITSAWDVEVPVAHSKVV